MIDEANQAEVLNVDVRATHWAEADKGRFEAFLGVLETVCKISARNCWPERGVAMKDELHDEADQSAPYGAGGDGGGGSLHGSGTNGQSTVLGNPWTDDAAQQIERFRAHYNALKASHDSLLSVAKLHLAMHEDQMFICGEDDAYKVGVNICKLRNAIAQAEALNEKQQ